MGPYDIIRHRCTAECGEDSQAHHIVPDYLLGTGSRAMRMGGDRIGTPAGSAPLPSFDAGPAICLAGNAKSAGTEHNTAHGGDTAIGDAGQKSPIPGTIDLQKAIDLTVPQAIAARPDCALFITAAVKGAFGGVDPNTLLRSTQQPPKPGSPAFEFFKPRVSD